ICFLTSGDTISIVPTFRQFCACLSDGHGASFGMIARYGVSFRCRYTSYTFAAAVQYVALPLVYLRPRPADIRLGAARFRSAHHKRRKTRLADLSPAVILST